MLCYCASIFFAIYYLVQWEPWPCIILPMILAGVGLYHVYLDAANAAKQITNYRVRTYHEPVLDMIGLLISMITWVGIVKYCYIIIDTTLT